MDTVLKAVAFLLLNIVTLIGSAKAGDSVDGDLRLVDGVTNTSGRVEIFYNGRWGTVCDNSFDFREASVVCNQLGFRDTRPVVWPYAPAGSGPILLDDLGCTGDEAALTECRHLPWGEHSCLHANDAGVECDDSSGYNYTDVVEKSILFFEAQRSGALPANNRIPWRGDSALGDAGHNGEDLTGGWYDAGDAVKFGLPMAYAATTLAWGLVTWPEVYQAIGQIDEMLDCIRWPLDYFIKAHTAPNELYVQVGDASYDHKLWIPPEVLPAYRPSYKIDPLHPGSDAAAETAAALAAGYIAFKTSDLTYANVLLTHARQLYNFANQYRGKYSDSVTEARGFYTSGAYEDELAWAATWLYKATVEQQYLTAAEDGVKMNRPYAFSWGDKTAGTQVLLYQLTGKAIYRTAVESFLNFWKNDIPYTPKGLAYRQKWGANKYAAAAAVVALMAAEAGVSVSANTEWARGQIHYMLGDGGMSYVVGFGANFPLNPHHRAASCPDTTCGWSFFKSNQTNAHELTGALVGGPDIEDNHNDVRSNFIGNEPSCFSSVFQTAVVGLMGVTPV